MDITKRDSQLLKGAAILAMLMLHLFCRVDNLPYTPLVYVGSLPLVYYLGLFGDICVPIYCFASGYAHFLKIDENTKNGKWRGLLSNLQSFLINYWVIVVLFSVVGLFFDTSGQIPGSAGKFFLNFLALENSYNGAWWFANTYIILVLTAPLTVRLIQGRKWWLALIGSFVLYAVGYAIRFWGLVDTGLPWVQWTAMKAALVGTSCFPYVIGMVFRKYRVVDRLRAAAVRVKPGVLSFASVLLVVYMIICHGIVPTLFVAPITAIVTICLLCVCRKPRWLEVSLGFFGGHSTNIWLIHMFFYLTLFKGLVFYAKYPILIFFLLLGLSLAASYAVNAISRPLKRLVR